MLNPTQITKAARSALPRSFYERDTIVVARELLGKRIVRQLADTRLEGIITEVEAYLGETDSASHASRGRTPRTTIMYGPAGHAYIYFVYGMHFMFNVVTRPEEKAAAVLIRAVYPTVGTQVMQQRRKRPFQQLTDGPAKLCQAFSIDKTWNGWDMTRGSQFWLTEGVTFPQSVIQRGPRIGIPYATEQDRNEPRRFWVDYTTAEQIASRLG